MKDTVLENFIKEFFPFDSLCKAGLFRPEWKNDYQVQAKKLCEYFGYETVYEYGSKEIRAHISFVDYNDGDPFVTVIPSIYG